MSSIERKYRLGDLIVHLGLLTRKDLEETLQIASETNLPVGRVLTMSGLISEEQLQGLIRCQSLLKEGLINLDQAKTVLVLVSEEGVRLDQALEKAGWKDTQSDTTPLGDLLLTAGLVAKTQLDLAFAQSRTTNLPVGRILVLSGILEESILTAAINAQILVRDKKITKEQAVEGLKEARHRQVAIEVPLVEKGFYELPKRRGVRLGELLVYAGLLSDSELINAVEIGLLNKKAIGQVLIDLKLVTERVLEAALALQSMIADGSLTIADGKAVLLAIFDGLSLTDALAKVTKDDENSGKKTISLVYLLKLIGCIDDDAITSAFHLVENNTQVMMNVLRTSGVLDETTLNTANRCKLLVDQDKLSLEHACVAFNYSQRRGITVEEALHELQWHVGDEAVAGKEGESAVNNHFDENGWQRDRDLAVKFMADGDAVGAKIAWQKLVRDSEIFGGDDPKYIMALEGLAETHSFTKDYSLAESLFKEVLESKTKILGGEHLAVAFTFNNLAKVSYFQQKYGEAEKYAEQYLQIYEHLLGAEHPDTACGWQNLATLYHVQEKHEKAAKAYQKAIDICQKRLGGAHPTTTTLVRSYAKLLQKMQKFEEAEALDSYAQGLISGRWRSLEVPVTDQFSKEE